MKLKFFTELYWILGCLATTTVLGFWMLRGNILHPEPLEVQLHDTYIVIPQAHLLLIILAFLLTSVYLLRWIYHKINNKIVSTLLTVLLLIVVTGQIMYLDWINGLEYHLRIVYSREMDHEIQAHALSGIRIVKTVIWTMLIMTGVMVVIAGYKTLHQKKG